MQQPGLALKTFQANLQYSVPCARGCVDIEVSCRVEGLVRLSHWVKESPFAICVWLFVDKKINFCCAKPLRSGGFIVYSCIAQQ